MTQVAETAKVQLSHREAHLLIRTVPLDMQGEKLQEEQVAAMKHYFSCDECQREGLSQILGTPTMICKEAIEKWLLRDMYTRSLFATELTCYTVGEQLAIEHIFGRQLVADGKVVPIGWHNRFGNCTSAACSRMYQEVQRGFVGSSHFSRCHHAALRVFREQGWEIKTLVAGQRKLLEEQLSKGGRKANGKARLAIAKLCELAASAGSGEEKATKLTKLLVEGIEPLQLRAVMRAKCENAGSAWCGWYATDRDCGVGCAFTVALVSVLHGFIRECLGMPAE